MLQLDMAGESVFFRSPSSYKIDAIFTKSMCVHFTAFSIAKVKYFGTKWIFNKFCIMLSLYYYPFVISDAGTFKSKFWVRTWTFSKSFNSTPNTWLCYWYLNILRIIVGLEHSKTTLVPIYWTFVSKNVVEIKANVRT